jgi:hypothetical protein
MHTVIYLNKDNRIESVEFDAAGIRDRGISINHSLGRWIEAKLFYEGGCRWALKGSKLFDLESNTGEYLYNLTSDSVVDFFISRITGRVGLIIPDAPILTDRDKNQVMYYFIHLDVDNRIDVVGQANATETILRSDDIQINKQLHDFLVDRIFHPQLPDTYRWMIRVNRLVDSFSKMDVSIDVLLKNPSILLSFAFDVDRFQPDPFDRERYDKAAKEINEVFDKIGIK